MRRVSRVSAAFGAAVIALVASIAAPVSTQSDASGALDRFTGTYRNPIADGGGERIRAAIESVVVDMAPLRQSVARRRLLESDPPIPRISIARFGDGLVVDYTHGRRNTTPRLGAFAPNPSAAGGTIDVKHDVVGSRLRETYRENRGGAVHLFTLSSDRRELTLEATIRSPHLPRAIVYSLVFDRTH